ncbi:hypothetical protein T492DRAFT_138225 [Pavlovales sp. CCMP2436]|nr:hypothetical protein T492DRAFT_138225 [Pavlovales sp. CCMP2436]
MSGRRAGSKPKRFVDEDEAPTPGPPESKGRKRKKLVPYEAPEAASPKRKKLVPCEVPEAASPAEPKKGAGGPAAGSAPPRTPKAAAAKGTGAKAKAKAARAEAAANALLLTALPLSPGAAAPIPEASAQVRLMRLFAALEGRGVELVAPETNDKGCAPVLGVVQSVVLSPGAGEGEELLLNKKGEGADTGVEMHIRLIDASGDVQHVLISRELCGAALRHRMQADVCTEDGMRVLVAADLVAVRVPLPAGPQGDAAGSTADYQWRLAQLYLPPGATSWMERGARARVHYLDGGGERAWLDMRAGKSAPGMRAAPVVVHTLELWRSAHWTPTSPNLPERQSEPALQAHLRGEFFGSLESWHQRRLLSWATALGDGMVGSWVAVYWDGDDVWFDAQV